MTIALAEHLFGKLAPGQSYVIDNRVRGKKEKEMCQCRLDHCHGRPKFDCTGIGKWTSSSHCIMFDIVLIDTV